MEQEIALSVLSLVTGLSWATKSRLFAYYKEFIILFLACFALEEAENVIENSDRIICGNKTPTRCNRCFYCISYCLLNMFRAPLCPSSGAQEYYTVVAACGISCCGFQVAGLVWS